MKARLFLIAALSVTMSLCASAADRQTPFSSPGYAGNVGIELGGIVERGVSAAILTEHGYQFGFGLFTGIGTGVIYTPEAELSIAAIPFFLDVRYRFMDGEASPFVSMKFGGCYYYDTSFGLYAAPSVGVDIGRWSLFLKYDYRSCADAVYVYRTEYSYFETRGMFRAHALSVGVNIWF